MRDIKFRLIKGNKIVGYERHILCCHTISIQHQKIGEDIWHFICPDYKYWIPHDSKEQFTGLHDKKRTKEYPEGQEIYAGDIIEYGIPEKLPNGNLNLNKSIIKRKVVERDDFVRCGFNIMGCVQNIYKIIGNSTENPELLEKLK